MFNQLCQRIRDLTLQAAEFVGNKEIEQSLALLVERQRLLEQLKVQFLSTGDDPDISTNFTSLLLWIQQQDAISSAQVVQFREQSKQETVTQVKIKKALHHYKNVT